MYKNYFFLNRYILELKPFILGGKILSVFSQDKDRLLIQLKNDDENVLEISVNPGEPYLILKNRFNRAKKNTLDFFTSLLGASINNILIANDDRIIKITTSSGSLYFAIRGKFTNLFYDADTFQSFKKEEQSILTDINKEFKGKEFLDYFNIPSLNEFHDKNIDEIRKAFPFIGREITNEVKLKNNINSDRKNLLEVLEIIKNSKPVVFFNDNTNEIHIGFEQLLIFSTFQKTLFDDLIIAFNSYFNKKYYFEKRQVKLKKISNTIEREIKKLTSKLNNLNTVINRGCKEEELKKIGNILLINLSKIKSGFEEVELDDIYEGQNKIKIMLDPKLTPHQNADNYFAKARADRINFKKSTKFYIDAQKEFEKLKAIENKLSGNLTLEQLDEIMKEMKIKDQIVESSKEDLSMKFKHYIIQDKYHVYVGKDSKNNDLLTTKFAKQNDYWFHARSVSGSHVVLRVENTKEVIPKNIIKNAASLAAYHSKAKTSGLAPVSYTFKKYVFKRKGTPIGQVSLTKEEVLLVKPEIPANCVYQAGD